MAKRPMTEAQLANLKKNQFPKGKTGNAKGRPPLPEELKASIAYLTPKAIETVEEIMLHGKNEMARLKAAELFIATHVSKAAQKLDVSGEVQHTFTSDLLAKAAKAREIIEGQVIEAQALPAPVDTSAVE